MWPIVIVAALWLAAVLGQAELVSEIILFTTIRTNGCGKPVSLYINKTYDNATIPSKGVIIAFPGTAFLFPRQFYFEHEAFALLGYTFYQVNVRVYNTHKTLAACAMQDGRDAIKYITETLETQQERFFIYAGSAGGAVSLNSLAVHGSKFRAMALVGPVVDTLAFFKRGGQKKVLKSKAYAKRCSPTKLLPVAKQKQRIPPMHFFVGTKDTSAPFKPTLVNFATMVSQRVHGKKAGGVIITNGDAADAPEVKSQPYRIVYYENEIHGFQDLLPEARRDWLRQDLISRVVEFYDEYS